MSEDPKVINIDGTDYTEDQLSDAAKARINLFLRVNQKIQSLHIEMEEQQMILNGHLAKLKEELDGQTDSSVSAHAHR
tara:strand:+ start:28 stop:261 length:234 start_codon:yes stop_codon:yes gene_type:complete